MKKYLRISKKTEASFELCAQPRGVLCHWIAGNIPTLSFFSLVQGVLSKNGNILKVPPQNKNILLSLLKKLSKIKLEFEGCMYSGDDIVSSVAVVSFDGRSDKDLSEKMSLAADCKVIWGDSAGIKSVINLPQKEHCEIIVFGPKYSFGVFDKETIEGNNFDGLLKKTVVDIVVFNQMACSSPHVLFFEKSRYSIEKIIKKMQVHFEGLPEELLTDLPQTIASRIINERAKYLLSGGKQVLGSKGVEWTILVNQDIGLEEPIQGRTVFVKEVDGLEKVLPLITRKIQAVSVSINDENKKRAFAKKVSFLGVDRITSPGSIHNFTLPWDGIMTLNRLVRWTILS